MGSITKSIFKVRIKIRNRIWSCIYVLRIFDMFKKEKEKRLSIIVK
jgi:hypothetical protein